MEDFILNYAAWISVAILSLGYWFQVWKIHVHREVRDLSLASYCMLWCGFLILAVTAYLQKSTIFMVKQISTSIPVFIICCQILIHKEDHWHDDDDPLCESCGEELEPHWRFCAYCGTKGPVIEEQKA